MVRDLIRRPSVRLLTLTGPPGIGKTRLSVEAAAGLVSSFPDGVWFVSLAPIRDPELVLSSIARALDLKESGTLPLQQTLHDYLRERELLLVLDNFEQVVEAAPLVAGLLAAAPALKVLVTSREMMHVRGEQEFVVPALALPDPDHLPPIEHLSRYDAVQLFTQRAAEVKLDFALTAENAAPVARICKRLDGLPLAIELAAARVKVLPPHAMLERLDQRLHLLVGGARDLPPRQRTLRHAIEWSHDLLSEQEKRLFRRMSVFQGGCTLAAVERVCNADGDLGLEPLDGVASLLDKSMLKQEVDSSGAPRFFMLETILEYAGEKLQESGEEAIVRRHHALYILNLAQEAGSHLREPDITPWLARLDDEYENIRAVLRWSRNAGGDPDTGLQLAAAIGRYWIVRSYAYEGRELLSTALSGARERTSSRGWALSWAGELAYMQCDYGASRSYFQESLGIFRDVGDKLGIAAALDGLGEVATEEGDYETAVPLFEEWLSYSKELGDIRGIGDALTQLGWAAMRTGDYLGAATHLKEALALFRQRNDHVRMALVLSGLGEVAVRQGDYAAAVPLLEESLGIRRQLENKWGIGVTLGSLGWVALFRRDYEQAVRLLLDSLVVRKEIGDKGGIAWCLEKLAEAAMALGDAGRAARLYGAAHTLRRSINSVVDPADQPEYERNLAHVRATLGEVPWSRAWSEGQEMTLEQAIAYAQTASARSERAAASPTARPLHDGLTERERQIAVLIARSKSNSEIARELVITKRTVETHIGNILAKLGFTSRGQVAAWAIKHGLGEESG